LVLLVAVCIGALIGLLVGLFQALRLRREVAALKRELRAVQQSSDAPLLPPSDLL
jgi:sensor c-di-GMP phosphodiesterase-like protein